MTVSLLPLLILTLIKNSGNFSQSHGVQPWWGISSRRCQDKSRIHLQLQRIYRKCSAAHRCLLWLKIFYMFTLKYFLTTARPLLVECWASGEECWPWEQSTSAWSWSRDVSHHLELDQSLNTNVMMRVVEYFLSWPLHTLFCAGDKIWEGNIVLQNIFSEHTHTTIGERWLSRKHSLVFWTSGVNNRRTHN